MASVTLWTEIRPCARTAGRTSPWRGPAHPGSGGEWVVRCPQGTIWSAILADGDSGAGSQSTWVEVSWLAQPHRPTLPWHLLWATVSYKETTSMPSSESQLLTKASAVDWTSYPNPLSQGNGLSTDARPGSSVLGAQPHRLPSRQTARLTCPTVDLNHGQTAQAERAFPPPWEASGRLGEGGRGRSLHPEHKPLGICPRPAPQSWDTEPKTNCPPPKRQPESAAGGKEPHMQERTQQPAGWQRDGVGTGVLLASGHLARGVKKGCGTN